MLTTDDKKHWFRKVKRAPIRRKDAVILQYCTNRLILDVGCVGQDRSYESKDWLHQKIKKTAGRIVGVDVDQAGLEQLKKKGYEVVDTSGLEDLNLKFDVVLMADVIEHVDNPVDLIKSYSRYLNNEGLMLITTPNATRLRTFFEILTTTTYSMNLEHTCWFCPKTMLEVFSRAGVSPVEFYWLKEYMPKLRYRLYAPLLWILRNFNSNFLFICKNGRAD